MIAKQVLEILEFQRARQAMSDAVVSSSATDAGSVAGGAAVGGGR